MELDDLRQELVEHLGYLLIGASGLAVWLSMPIKPFPIILAGLFSLMLGLGVAVSVLTHRHPVGARHLAVGGLTVLLLAAMWLFEAPWLPFYGLLLIWLSAILISGSEFIAASSIFATAYWFNQVGARTYPLLPLAIFFTSGLLINWSFVLALFTALGWMRSTQRRADQLLGEVRNHRAELQRVLKSYELANIMLRRAERELILARNQAVQAKRLKEQFAANISHELRTPLNLILGFSEMIYLSPEVYGDLEWPVTLRRDVHQIYRSSRHLLDLIDDVLDLSRFEMAGFTLNRAPTDLAALLNDTANIAADLFRGQPVHLEVKLDGGLPLMEIDRTRITQVILNLLNNAQRFTSEGKVTLAAQVHDDEVWFSVSDTGPGIPAEKLPHIFDEFYQVDQSLRRSHQGAGLGLAISKRFMKAHGGRIWVESVEGMGTTFFCALPVTTFTPIYAAAGDWMTAWKRLAEQPYLLVVDPDPAVAAQVDRFFDEYNVVQVKNAAELPGAAQIYRPQAVVYNVPPNQGHAGLTAATGLSAPIIECSLPSHSWMVNQLSVVACLTKPIAAQALRKEVARLAGVHHILIIDDDRGFTQLVTRMLETDGNPYRLQRAYSGAAGLQAMREQPPDLVLLDLAMPEVDGFQILSEMRSDEILARVPVILLTATSYVEDALSQYGNQMLVRRSRRLNTTEVLTCIGAIVGVLEPRYEDVFPAVEST